MENFMIERKNRLMKTNLIAKSLKRRTKTTSQVLKKKNHHLSKVTDKTMPRIKINNDFGVSGQNCVINDTPFDHMTKQNFKQTIREMGAINFVNSRLNTFHRSGRRTHSKVWGDRKNLNSLFREAISQTRQKSESKNRNFSMSRRHNFKHQEGCPRLNGNTDYQNDQQSLRVMYNSSAKDSVCTCEPPGMHNMDYEFDISDNTLPLISKIYDFNPDFPSYEKCLLDIETYKKIIGKIKEVQQRDPQKYSINEPGFDSRYGSDFSKFNRLHTSKNMNTAHFINDIFNYDRFREMNSPDEKSQFSSKAMSLNQTQNMKGYGDNDYSNNQEDVSLVKTSEYVCDNEKVINDALFPRKILRALKKKEFGFSQEFDESPSKKSPENQEQDLTCHKLKAYEDALAMLRSIRAIPDPGTACIKLERKDSNSPEKKAPKLQKLQKLHKSKKKMKPSKSPRSPDSPPTHQPEGHSPPLINEDLRSLQEQESAVIKENITGYPMTQIPDSIIKFQ
ncbi:unnamed protein product [Moneuplotes crassus]|uniref:Uncharacterized protein n=1 Tax=Euplotes crassus TaxID=5936 RepID=A0AAD1U9M1_EUPCR|nr:unnamed protein product [Moneuplotes crassus]